MYNSSGLIPARFLILISHFIICVLVLWNKENMRECVEKMDMGENVISFNYHNTQLVIGVSLMIAFLCFEMLAFVFGLTMFNSNSAMLSVTGHFLACIFLTGMVLNDWHCFWFWWIFTLGSTLPFVHDIIITFDILLNKKY